MVGSFHLSPPSSANNAVNIFDRRGQIKLKVTLNGPCVCMDWDKDGNLLAILQERSNIALLWNAHYNTMVELDTGLKYVGVCRLIPYTYVSKYMFVFFQRHVFILLLG